MGSAWGKMLSGQSSSSLFFLSPRLFPSPGSPPLREQLGDAPGDAPHKGSRRLFLRRPATCKKAGHLYPAAPGLSGPGIGWQKGARHRCLQAARQEAANSHQDCAAPRPACPPKRRQRRTSRRAPSARTGPEPGEGLARLGTRKRAHKKGGFVTPTAADLDFPAFRGANAVSTLAPSRHPILPAEKRVAHCGVHLVSGAWLSPVRPAADLGDVLGGLSLRCLLSPPSALPVSGGVLGYSWLCAGKKVCGEKTVSLRYGFYAQPPRS